MRHITLIGILIAVLLGACSTPRETVKLEKEESPRLTKEAPKKLSKDKVLSFEGADSTEYELIVFDPRFDTYLAVQARPITYYSAPYLKSWNLRYVSEWNTRYSSGRYGDLYPVYIDYQPQIEYGKELDYELYQFFRFFEKSSGVSFGLQHRPN